MANVSSANEAMPRYRSTGRFALESLEGLLVAPLILVGWPFVGRSLGQWGSTRRERDAAWPGDAFVTEPAEVFTRAVDIDAPRDVVWRWVVQFGLGRAGFYSYELFERLAGIEVRNVESIMPEEQEIHVGDEIKLHQSAPGIWVSAVEPGRHLCFSQPAGQEPSIDPLRSWSLYLEPLEPSGCRLLLRSCIEAPRDTSLKKRVSLAVETPVDFLMEQRMLRTIRRLAERS